MGNQHSNGGDGGGGSSSRPPFGRGGNALGLSRSELDKRCQPSGLYASCAWEDRAIRKLIGDGKAAPRLKGSEFRSPDSTEEECPICFLYYKELNTTKCCNANICTECFLQVRPQKDKQATCPFCNHSKLNIVIAKTLSEGQIEQRNQEEKRIEELILKSRMINSEDLTTTSTPEEGEENDNPDNTQQQESQSVTKPMKIPKSPGTTNRSRSGSTASGFGSSLEQDSRVAMFRARSESFASSERSEDNCNPKQQETNFIQSIAMTPEERRRLEAEMRNQNLHPLALQVEAEAQQRILQNEQAFQQTSPHQRRYRSSSDVFGRSRSSRRRGRGQSARDWNQIVDAFERGGHGAINSLDDLVVLEAAILLSMEEEARHSRDAATGSGDDSNNSNENDFDAAQHAGNGFPLVRTLLADRGLDDEADSQRVRNLARSLNSSRRGNQLLRSGRTRMMPDTARDTAAMLMRGISEEEQMAMAIAASLQDQGATTSAESEGDNARDGDEADVNGEGVSSLSIAESSSEDQNTEQDEGSTNDVVVASTDEETPMDGTVDEASDDVTNTDSGESSIQATTVEASCNSPDERNSISTEPIVSNGD